MRMAQLLTAVLYALCPLVCWAQRTAVSEDGRRVVLKDDGSWEYVQALAADGVAGIRKVTWGMNRNQVKQAEELSTQDDFRELVSYRVRVAGLLATLEYKFDNDALISAGYVIEDTYTNKSAYIDEYERLELLLTTKYGDPYRDDEIWRSIQFKEHRQQWGAAVRLGHLAYVTEWQTDAKSIRLNLSSANNALDFSIRYYDPQLAPGEAQSPEQKALDDL